VTKRVHVLVSGRVQGVFYRAECANHARDLGLGGFVRNTADGRVEAAFEGPEDRIDQMIAWCRQGSSWSRVEAVEVSDEEPQGEREFRIK
jgi:acylphosphatase